MNKHAILINGISLPYQVLDNGLEKARSAKQPIKAVFIYENPDEEDIVAPREAELNKADFTDQKARKNMKELVHHNAEYVETYFAQKDMLIEKVILKNPTVEDIVDAMKDVDRIYLDHDTFEHPDEFAYVNFTFEELQKELSPKIERRAD